MSLKTTLRFLARSGPVARTMLDGLAHRGELALLDLAAARSLLLASAALVAGACVLAVLAGMALTFACAAAVWHRPDRGLLLVLLALGELLVAGGFVGFVVRRFRGWRPFADTLAQLGKDKECLCNLMPDSDDPAPPPPSA